MLSQKILFGAAIGLGVVIFLYELLFTNGQVKRGILATPFLLLLAAAVAKYLGM